MENFRKSEITDYMFLREQGFLYCLGELAFLKAMMIVGYRLKEVSAVRKRSAEKPFHVEVTPIIKDVRQDELELEKKKPLLVFEVEFLAKYSSPKGEIGEVRVVVEVRYFEKAKELSKALKTWREKKKLEPKVAGEVMKFAFDVAQVEAIYLARKVLLPSPIPLPKIELAKRPPYIG